MYFHSEIAFTHHARQRISERQIAEWAVKTIIKNGDCRYRDDKRIFTIGDDSREATHFHGLREVDLRGIHVVCQREKFVVITVYRDDVVRLPPTCSDSPSTASRAWTLFDVPGQLKRDCPAANCNGKVGRTTDDDSDA